VPTEFVVKIVPLIGDVLVEFSNFVDRLLPSVASPFASGEMALLPSEFNLCVSEEMRGINTATIGSHKERLQTKIDSDRGQSRGFHFNIGKFAYEDNVPFVNLMFEGNGLDFTFNGTVKFDLYVSDMLEVNLAPFEFASITISGEYYSIESVPPFEPRVSGLLAVLDPAEESSECPIESAECGLAGRKVGFRKVRIFSS